MENKKQVVVATRCTSPDASKLTTSENITASRKRFRWCLIIPLSKLRHLATHLRETVSVEKTSRISLFLGFRLRLICRWTIPIRYILPILYRVATTPAKFCIFAFQKIWGLSGQTITQMILRYWRLKDYKKEVDSFVVLITGLLKALATGHQCGDSTR